MLSRSARQQLTSDQEETRNCVEPDFYTGGEAIADMLQSNRTLEWLNVSWNYICKDSAFALGDALRYNDALTHLDVAHNAFCDIPAQQLADALATNHTIAHLNLSYNSVTTAATMVLGNSLKTNQVGAWCWFPHDEYPTHDGNRDGTDASSNLEAGSQPASAHTPSLALT